MIYRPLQRENKGLTFGVAPKVPLGVVLATYSGRLSRVFVWDTTNDTFSPGQFIKARVSLEAISPDGKYFAYRAECLRKYFQSYSAIAKPGFFTALAFLPHSHCGGIHIEFHESGDITILTPFFNSGIYDLWKAHIAPNFPHQIITEGDWKFEEHLSTKDPHRNREFYVEGFLLYERALQSGETRLLGDFNREPFVAIEPPDWAKVW